MEKVRGFEKISNEKRKNPNVDIELPIRGDLGSAGYDIKTPVEIVLLPNEKKVVFTDIKAYMQQDEVLELYVRSSVGIKKGVVLSNGTGIIDSSYYNNLDNEGNIGLALHNLSNEVVYFDAQERICQGIFKKYLTIDNDTYLNNERVGGIGSTNK